MYGKKGMSPLIATILLMAFAVALGAVIMNWGASLPEGVDCGAVKIQVQKFCLADNKIQLDVRNIGEMGIAEVRLQITDPPIKTNVEITESALGKGERLTLAIPYAYSSEARVGILPSVSSHGEVQMCPAPLQEVQGLPDCA